MLPIVAPALRLSGEGWPITREVEASGGGANEPCWNDAKDANGAGEVTVEETVDLTGGGA